MRKAMGMHCGWLLPRLQVRDVGQSYTPRALREPKRRGGRPMGKLNEGAVRFIREGSLSVKEIVKMYNITPSYAYQVRAGNTHKEIM